MIVFSNTLPNCYEFDDSVFDTEGVFYDLGCLRWEWIAPFAGRKLVVGVDPQKQSAPAGCELVRAAVTPYAGNVYMHGTGLQCECSDGAHSYIVPHGYADGRIENIVTPDRLERAITWAQLTAQYGPAAMVKINIEGAEIPLLFTAQQPMAPQLIVAFHQPGQDYSQANWPQKEVIDACIAYLCNWYTMRRTRLYHSAPDTWYHFMLRK